MIDVLLGGNAVWFGVPALVGTLFFLGRVVVMLVGGGDVHGDGDLGSVDAGGSDLHHPDSTEAFQILSIQAIAAFLMGFGWGGLGVVRGWGMPVVAGVATGLLTGGAMTWILGRLFRWILQLQSSGTLPFEAALYEEGVVYVTVPAERKGRGTVRVVVNQRLQYYPAVTDGAALVTGTPVRITDVNNADHTLTVESLSPSLPPVGDPT